MLQQERGMMLTKAEVEEGFKLQRIDNYPGVIEWHITNGVGYRRDSELRRDPNSRAIRRQLRAWEPQAETLSQRYQQMVGGLLGLSDNRG